MKIRVLGCYGAEFPGFHTMSFLINDAVLLDAGAITANLGMNEQEAISDILITHSHLDHIKDILFLADNLTGRVNRPVNIVTTSGISAIIRKNFLNNTVWPDFTLIPAVSTPVIQFKEISTDEFYDISSLRIKAFNVNHTVEAVGYLISDGGGSIIHSGDTGPSQRLWEVANETENLRAIFIETSFPNSMNRLAEISRHLTPAMLEEELLKLENRNIPVYIIHIKPQYFDMISREIKEINYPALHFIHQGEELFF